MKHQVTIKLPMGGSPHDYQAAICEAISYASLIGDSLGAGALAGLLAQIRTPTPWPWNVPQAPTRIEGFATSSGENK